MENVLDPMDFVEGISAEAPATYNSTEMQLLQIQAEQDRRRRLGITKALTTGDGQVLVTDTGGRATRNEFIHGALANESYSEKNAVGFNRLPKVPVKNTAIQWVAQSDIGQNGDGFLAENGVDGAFNGNEQDGDFRREIENVKFMHDVRRTGLVASQVDSTVNLPDNQAKNAVRFIKGQANIATYWGDARTNALAWNGMKSQIMKGVEFDSSNQVILFDAAGYTLDKEIEEEACKVGGLQYANLKSQYMGYQSLADLNVSLFPQQRSPEPTNNETIGSRKTKFMNPFDAGDLQFVPDPMLRVNQPLVPAGKGSDGKARTATTVSPGALAFGATPWVTGGGHTAAASAGAGSFWANTTKNTDAAALATAPAVPTSISVASSPGGNGNRLAADTYYYAVSCVYLGRESRPWVLGASAVGSVTSATGVAVTAGQVVKLELDYTQITSYANYDKTRIRFRIYRKQSTLVPTGAPLAVTDFDFLMETGIGIDGTSICYDNGMYIAGTESSFITSDNDDDGLNVFYAELCPLLKRELPHNLLSDVFGYIAFGTLILKKRGRHIWIRNIGRTFRS